MTQNTAISVSPAVIKQNVSKLMVFELSSGGHYPEYLTHLINYWHQADLKENLLLVVSNQFCQKHPEVVDLVGKKVSLTTITPSEEQKLVVASSTAKRIIRAFQEFKLAAKYAEKLRANEILFTYFDTRQLPLAFGKKLPCPCSGIYFRPRFYYGNLTGDRINWQEKLARWQEKWLLAKALKNSQMKCVFSLDPFAVKYFPKLSSQVKAFFVPDPVETSFNSNTNTNIDRDQLRANLEIEPHRTVFLLFGGLTKRKGILPVLKAIGSLEPDLAQKISLILAGPASVEFQTKIQQEIANITKFLPVQIITNYRYINSEAEKKRYFQVSDVILATYQRHVGMSAIIVRAAAAQKPVMSSDYGLMGEITRRHQLGITLDSTNHLEIAQGFRQLLAKPPNEFLDREGANQFARQNSAVNFAHTIFQHLNITQ